MKVSVWSKRSADGYKFYRETVWASRLVLPVETVSSAGGDAFTLRNEYPLWSWPDQGNLPGLRQSMFACLWPTVIWSIFLIRYHKEVLLVGDVLSTGYFGVINGKPNRGKISLIFGAGPVGLCGLPPPSCSPSRIILVDLEDYRLEAGLKWEPPMS
jgi:hypothetical protein